MTGGMQPGLQTGTEPKTEKTIIFARTELKQIFLV